MDSSIESSIFEKSADFVRAAGMKYETLAPFPTDQCINA